MELLGHIGALEVAGHAMLDAVATAWVNLIALEEILSVMRTCVRGKAYTRARGRQRRNEQKGGLRSRTFIFRALHRRHPARLFLWDLLGGIGMSRGIVLSSLSYKVDKTLAKGYLRPCYRGSRLMARPEWLVTRPRRETGEAGRRGQVRARNRNTMSVESGDGKKQ